MKKHLSILAVFITSSLFAKPPGFFGKTVYLNYDFTPGLALDKYNKDYELTPVGVNLSHEFSIHKVTRRRLDWFAFYNRSTTVASLDVDEFSRNEFGTDFVESSLKLFDISSNSVGLGMRYYVSGKKRKWLLAPIGSYIDLKLYYSSHQIDEFKFDQNNTPAIKHSYGNLGFGVGFGQQTVIFNHLPLSYGMQFNIPSNVLSAYSSVIESGFSSVEYIRNTDVPVDLDIIEAMATQRNFTKSIIEFKIGIGILAL